jgi:hypothetical protein
LKQIRLASIFVFTAVVSCIFLVINTTSHAQHGFSVPQYGKFHDVLHRLEHDALPNKDFRRIRDKALELARLGKEIVAVGVPSGTKEEQKEEFAGQLKKFDKALSKFRTDARNGSNTKLKASYSAVHDTFEILAAMLPRG